MYKGTATPLLDCTPEEIRNWLNSFDSVLTDCDGVLWVLGNVLTGSSEVINRFKKMGKNVYLCTNNSTKTRSELLEKALKLGFQVNENEIISTAHTLAAYLKKIDFKRTVYIVGSRGIAKELDAVGIAHTSIGPDYIPSGLGDYLSSHFHLNGDIGAVVVGFDEYFSFPKIIKAATYLSDPDCLFLATNTDERFPMGSVVIPGTGSLVRCIETCAERKAMVIGKPSPSICQHLIDDGQLNPQRTLIIGDRCNTDILLGYNCGFKSLLVGSGIHSMENVAEWRQSNNPELHHLIPDVFIPKLGDLLPFM